MAEVASVQSGDWNDPTTWSSGEVPGHHDFVTVATGHTVSGHGTEGSPLVLEADGVRMVGACDMSHVLFRVKKGVFISRDSPMPLSYGGYAVEGVGHFH